MLSLSSRDAFWICGLTSGTSLVAGFIVFSILGFLAQLYSVSIDAVAESGTAPDRPNPLNGSESFWSPFPTWPRRSRSGLHRRSSGSCSDAVASVLEHLFLPDADSAGCWHSRNDLWAGIGIFLRPDGGWLILFFQQFVCVEAVITSVSDLFPKLLRSPLKHELVSFLLCVSSFLVHLILATQVSEEYHFTNSFSINRWENKSSRPFSLGRNLHIPTHWLLWRHQTLWQFHGYLWMSGCGLDFWWD